MLTLLGLLAFCILIAFVTFDQVVFPCVMSTKVSMTLFWNKVFFELLEVAQCSILLKTADELPSSLKVQ